MSMTPIFLHRLGAAIVVMASLSTVNAEDVKSSPDATLGIGAWSWTTKHTHIVAEGEVTNQSETALRNVVAHLTCRTATDQFVQSDSALVEFRTMLPGQSSPFKVIMGNNPAIKSCGLQFAMNGDLISAEKLPESPARNPILDGSDKDWYMTDTRWFAIQDTGIPECKKVPVYGFGRSHRPTIDIWIQTRLNEMGFDAGEADGKVGPQTIAAAKAFLRSIGGKKFEDYIDIEQHVFRALIPDKCFTAKVLAAY